MFRARSRSLTSTGVFCALAKPAITRSMSAARSFVLGNLPCRARSVRSVAYLERVGQRTEVRSAVAFSDCAAVCWVSRLPHTDSSKANVVMYVRAGAFLVLIIFILVASVLKEADLVSARAFCR